MFDKPTPARKSPPRKEAAEKGKMRQAQPRSAEDEGYRTVSVTFPAGAERETLFAARRASACCFRIFSRCRQNRQQTATAAESSASAAINSGLPSPAARPPSPMAKHSTHSLAPSPQRGRYHPYSTAAAAIVSRPIHIITSSLQPFVLYRSILCSCLTLY